jgi:hypothetical protein
MNLSELAHKHCTDKLVHGYMEFYPRYMNPVRETTKKVVELGIGLGASARLWLEYFPNAHIYVVDNDPKAIATVWDSVPSGRFTIIQADQTDPTIWKMVGGDIDFCIDDASHRPEHQIETFKLGFSHVRPGGWWIIEDVQCSFHPQFSDDPHMLFPWFNQLILEQQLFAIGDHDFYAARDSNPGNLYSYASKIYSFASYKSVLMFERAHD